MAKRFTDSDRWKNQAWLKKLHPFYKLAWVYITDECDHAGIWKIDVVDLKEYTSIPDFDLLDFVKKCNKDYDKLTGEEIIKERIRIIDRKYLWITGFMEFQYGGKSGDLPKNNIVTSAIDILKSMSLLNEAINKGFINPSETLQEHLGKGRERVKDKDKVKDSSKGLDKKDKNKKSEPSFSEFWEAYDKKVDKKKSKQKWNKLSTEEKESVMEFIPTYKTYQPDARFRKNPTTFFNNESWKDEFIKSEVKAGRTANEETNGINRTSDEGFIRTKGDWQVKQLEDTPFEEDLSYNEDRST